MVDRLYRSPSILVVGTGFLGGFFLGGYLHFWDLQGRCCGKEEALLILPRAGAANGPLSLNVSASGKGGSLSCN